MRIQALSDIFDADSFRSLVRQINVFTSNIGLNNMGGQIVDNVTIPAGSSIRIPHLLKITPKYRIIIKQVGGGYIVDPDEQWTDKYISLYNSGGTDAIISVLILKE